MTDNISPDHLRQFIDRIERLEAEKNDLLEDIKEVYAEAKGNGFDVKIMRQIVRIRKLAERERDEQETMIDIYKEALGMGISNE